ncbi:MAG: SAM-dependent chlorinase/fluorinase [Solirubrobacterales bacterium]|nr:SAM-dependent chlorinase/fluorinase [Solirubrobacterales bacterium]
MGARPITFLSDYGSDDEFAGVCRAVIARLAPEAPVVDLTHGIRRHDVRQGAAVLANTLTYAPAGVHLAVVDPGVGSPRKAVALRVGDEDRMLVGPDNGLLSLAVARFGGALEAADVSLSAVRLEPVSATFHGRDIFAPVAAHLALGATPGELGEPIEPSSLVGLELTGPAVEPDACLAAQVSHVDRFGNVVLLAGAEHAADAGLGLGRALTLEAGEERHEIAYALTFVDLPADELLLYLGSFGNLTLAVNRASAADRLGLGPGDAVVLRPV